VTDSRSPLEPTVERISRTEIVVAWPAYQVGCAFSRLRESDSGVIRAELSIESTRPDAAGHLGGPTLIELLRSGPEIIRLSNDLTERTGKTLPWKDLLSGAVRHVLIKWRTPPEPVDFADMQPVPEGSEYLFDGFIPKNKTTALMADQRSGKSTLAMAMSMATVADIALPCGWKAETTGPVLYLDWETDEESVQGSLIEIMNGLRLRSRPRGLHYMKMNGPLMNQVSWLQSLVGRLKPVMVVVDSLGWAAGGDLNKTEVAIPTMDALASLATTRLVLAHYAKGHRAGGESSASIFGSGFFEFACRSIWELRKESDAGSAFNVGLYNRKLSRGLEGSSMAVRLSFDGSRNSVEILPARVADSPELAAKQPLSKRITEILEAGPMATDELAEALSIGRDTPVSPATARTVAGGMRNVIRMDPSQTGRGKQQVWKLAESAKRNTPYRDRDIALSPASAVKSESAMDESAKSHDSLRFTGSRLPYADDLLPGRASRASSSGLAATGTNDDNDTRF
jgi:hypothetical protein